MSVKNGIRRFDKDVIAWVEGIDEYELNLASNMLTERGSAMGCRWSSTANSALGI